MDLTDTILDVIDPRSFSSLWYWIVLAVAWSSASHWVLGVPFDVVTRARRHGGQAALDLDDLAGVTALGAVLRFATLGAQSYHHDEIVTASRVLRVGFGHAMDAVGFSESAPPLYYALAWIWTQVAGTGEWGLRSLSAVVAAALLSTSAVAGDVRIEAIVAPKAGGAKPASGRLIVAISKDDGDDPIAQISEISAQIAANVDEQSAATQEIARSVQEAAQGTQTVTGNINEVRQAATGTGAAAGQVLDQAGALARTSSDLGQEVNAFIADVKAA